MRFCRQLRIRIRICICVYIAGRIGGHELHCQLLRWP